MKYSFNVKIENIIFILFNIMVLLIIIPYIFLGSGIIKDGVFFYNNLNNGFIQVSSKTRILLFIKDVIALLLILLLILKNKKYFTFLIFLFTIGIITLFISNNLSINMIIAGYRALSFAIATELFFKTYKNTFYQNKHFNSLLKILKITFYIELFTVILQVIFSGNLHSFGSGGSRFSGFFNGSGNLGCYAIAIIILFSILKNKYNYFSNISYWLHFIGAIFLTVASGTRTCMFIGIVILVYEIIKKIGLKVKIKKDVLIVSFLLLIILFGNKIFNFIITWTNRGNLSISGDGRISLFVNQIKKSNPFELLFGQGIGIGTNASIAMGLQNTQVSDSTINLIFTQFGFIGLFIFILMLIYLLTNLNKKTAVKESSIYLIVSILIMLFIGNIFEHNAMCILFIMSYALMCVNDGKTVIKSGNTNEK